MRTLMQIFVFFSLLATAWSVNACLLCLKSEPFHLVSADPYQLEGILEGYKICSSQVEMVMESFTEIETSKDHEAGRFVAVLAFFIGNSLLKNDSSGDRDLGHQYLDFASTEAAKHGIQLHWDASMFRAYTSK